MRVVATSHRQLTQRSPPRRHGGRLTDIHDGLGNAIHYTLDAMGNRTREDVKDPAGTLVRSQRRVYDALNRVQNLVTPAQ